MTDQAIGTVSREATDTVVTVQAIVTTGNSL
jgi:hypothetical protein